MNSGRRAMTCRMKGTVPSIFSVSSKMSSCRKSLFSRGLYLAPSPLFIPTFKPSLSTFVSMAISNPKARSYLLPPPGCGRLQWRWRALPSSCPRIPGRSPAKGSCAGRSQSRGAPPPPSSNRELFSPIPFRSPFSGAWMRSMSRR